VPGRIIGGLKTRGWIRGVRGGNRAWTWVWVGATGYGLVRRAVARCERVVLHEPLRPGESLLISHTTTTWREQSRRKRRRS